ncbi:hypothetical protein [Aquimarina agarivorans]|uniref:hypothetical protein n=1 Tax=Aquimarina agarivorans TaxID=980584 RepID=UPI000248ED05|nr:hypothetical protein [Aquimarina agarivorans]
MKKIYSTLLLVMIMFVYGNAQNVMFTDPNFKQALLDHQDPIIDTNGDNEISIEEAEKIKSIYLSKKKYKRGL